MLILDDPDTPLMLRYRITFPDRPAPLKLEVVRVATRGSIEERLRRALSDSTSIALYGIHFTFGKAEILPDSRPVLTAVASILREHPQLQLHLAGHTDIIGSRRGNMILSAKRAKSAAGYLIHELGVSTSRIETSGHGEDQSVPGTDQTTVIGRAINRRVEITFQ